MKFRKTIKKRTEDIREKIVFAKKALPLFLVFAVLCVSIFAVSKAAYGWFSLNKRVEAQGLKTSLEYINIKTEYGIGINEGEGEQDILSCEEWYNSAQKAFFVESDESDSTSISIFSGMEPREKIYMAVRYTNQSEKPYLLDLHLVQGVEVPLIAEVGEGELYAYFGSQLRVNNVFVGGDGGDEKRPVGSYLVPNPEGRSYFEESVTVPNHLKIASSLELGEYETLVLYIEIEFVDNNMEQNLYQEFGKLGDEECSRFIAVQVLDNIDN